MNGKKARKIRKSIEKFGNYYDNAEYIFSENPYSPKTIELSSDCGRSLYKKCKLLSKNIGVN